MVLFGSRVRGEAQDESDWDIAVFLTDDPTMEDRHRLTDLGTDLLCDTGQVIQSLALPLPKTHAGLNSRFSEFFRDVQPDGREQVGRLRRALDRRLIADYDAVDTLTVEDARVARDEAIAFVSFCERLTGAT